MGLIHKKLRWLGLLCSFVKKHAPFSPFIHNQYNKMFFCCTINLFFDTKIYSLHLQEHPMKKKATVVGVAHWYV